MSTSLTYLNLAASILGTMYSSSLHPLLLVGSVLWLAAATWQASRAGLLDN